jgi:hypothetical protein
MVESRTIPVALRYARTMINNVNEPGIYQAFQTKGVKWRWTPIIQDYLYFHSLLLKKKKIS